MTTKDPTFPAQTINSSTIAYESLSDGYGISLDGIRNCVEQLQHAVPDMHITNGHVVAFLLGELVGKATCDTSSADVSEQSLPEALSLEQKIGQIARTYYTGSVWDVLESLAFCLRMVEIAHMQGLKPHQSSERVKKDFNQQVVNAVRPACKLAPLGYPEALQMLFRRYAELGVTAEQALHLTLEADRFPLSPFIEERSF